MEQPCQHALHWSTCWRRFFIRISYCWHRKTSGCRCLDIYANILERQEIFQDPKSQPCYLDRIVEFSINYFAFYWHISRYGGHYGPAFAAYETLRLCFRKIWMVTIIDTFFRKMQPLMLARSRDWSLTSNFSELGTGSRWTTPAYLVTSTATERCLGSIEPIPWLHHICRP